MAAKYMTGKEVLNLKVGQILIGPESTRNPADARHVITRFSYKKLKVVHGSNPDGSVDARYSYWTKSDDPHDILDLIYMRAIMPDGTLGRETSYIRSHIEQYFKLDDTDYDFLLDDTPRDYPKTI